MNLKTKFLGTIYIYIIVVAILTLGFAYYHHGLVTKRINSILHYENKLELMSDRAKSLAKPDAVREVADKCMELAYG